MYVTTPAPSTSAHPNLSSELSHRNSSPNVSEVVLIVKAVTELAIVLANTSLQVFDESIVIVPAASDLTVVAFAPIILCASLTEPFSTKFK